MSRAPMGMPGAPDAGAASPPPPMPAEAKAELDRLRKLYPTERALLLPALHLAQRHWGGWLPEEAILSVAAELGLAPAEVYGVVTFYDLYHERPVGRHRIRVCTNVPCMLRGSTEVMAALQETLGVEENEVTPDGRCSYVHFECLGACEQAPIAMIDETYHGWLDAESIKKIVEGLE
jgi:NADH-quinone oxidoreductase E subunit